MLTLGALAYSSGKRDERPPADKSMLKLLPGDIRYESPSGRFRFDFPIATSLVVSAVLTLVLWLLR